MTVLHSGTTKRYSENWSQAFGAGAKNSRKSGAAEASAPKKSAKKPAPKKSAKK